MQSHKTWYSEWFICFLCNLKINNSPKTNITGTLGGSNFTFPRFCIGKFPLAGVLIFAECCPPPPFQSVDSLVSWADVFASKILKIKKKNKKIWL